MTTTMEDLMDLGETKDTPRQEIDACWSCGKELESQVQFNVEPGTELASNLRKRGIALSASEVDVLNRGLLCDDCVLAEACPTCGALGALKTEVEDRDDSVGYSAIEVVCSICIYGPLPELPGAAPAPKRQQLELFGVREYRLELKEVA